jgi:hypothetical protein
MKQYFFRFILFLILFFGFTLLAHGNEEIIGSVNGEHLYLNEFNRLFNAQVKKHGKESAAEVILNQMIDRTLVMQEAKLKGLTVNEAEINKRLDFIKEKQGGEEAFINFLTQNNATIEDAKNEIKYQILFDHIKNSIEAKDGKPFKSFLEAKKLNSDIVVFISKINPVKDTTPANKNKPEQSESISLRTKEYPAITKSKVKELEKLDEDTQNIIAEMEKSVTESTEIQPIEGIINESKLEKRKFGFPFRGKTDTVTLLNEEQIKALDSKTKYNNNYVMEEENKPDLENNQKEIIETIPGTEKNELAIDINKVTEPLILDPIKSTDGKKSLNLKKQLVLNTINPLKKELEKRNIITSTSSEPIKVTKDKEDINDLELLAINENEAADDFKLVPIQDEIEVIISDALSISNTSLKQDLRKQ